MRKRCILLCGFVLCCTLLTTGCHFEETDTKNDLVMTDVEDYKNEVITEETDTKNGLAMTDVEDYENEVITEKTDNDFSGKEAIGGTPDTIYKASFCFIPGYLSDYVGSKQYKEWQESVISTSNTCKSDPYQYLNIYEFIKYFDISRNELEELYYSSNLYYLYDYNFDVLYGDNKEDVYEYYNRTTPDNEIIAKRGTELAIKNDLKRYIGKSKFNSWFKATKDIEKTSYNDTLWSISEIVSVFGVSRSVLESIIKDNTGISDNIVKIEEVNENGEVSILIDNMIPAFRYNLDLLYSSDESVNAKVFLASEPEGLVGYELDELLHVE